MMDTSLHVGEQSPARNSVLFGAKRRSTVSRTPSFMNSSAGPTAPSTDIFASPSPAAAHSALPAHIRESTAASGKSVHWSPSVSLDRDRVSTPLKSSSIHGTATNAPPLRSLRDDIEPAKKVLRSLNPTILSSPHRSRSLATNASSSADSVTTESEDDVSDCWVTVFGFTPDQTQAVLKYFSRHGEVVMHQTPQRGNWVHIRYSCAIHAQQALARNGVIVDGTIRVGVVPCTEKDLISTDNQNTSVLSPPTIRKTPAVPAETTNSATTTEGTNQNASILREPSSNFNRSNASFNWMNQSIAEHPDEDETPAFSALNSSISKRGMRPLAVASFREDPTEKRDSIMGRLWNAVGF